jgi:hypothetical protein
MSAVNFSYDILDYRAQYLRPGVKKVAKTAQARVKRRLGKTQLADEVHTLHQTPRNLQDLSPAELEAYADWLLDDDVPASIDCMEDDGIDLSRVNADDDHTAIPLHLVGSLPDWMLNELEAANGSAFDTLSLFEAKRISPIARISMEDERLYA